jgi:hypothetical protein
MTKHSVWNMSLFEHFLKSLSLFLNARIWIRIRLRVESRIRIRICIKVVVHNTASGFTFNLLLIQLYYLLTQVMEDDQRACNGEFHTNEKGKVPPLVTTKFLTRDMGNSGRTFRIPYSVFRTSRIPYFICQPPSCFRYFRYRTKY